MKSADYIAPPCGCGECIQAGVDTEQRRRDPHTGILLHGYGLKKWLEARERCFRLLRAMVGKRGRHANGLEPLDARKMREPGEDDE